MCLLSGVATSRGRSPPGINPEPIYTAVWNIPQDSVQPAGLAGNSNPACAGHHLQRLAASGGGRGSPCRHCRVGVSCALLHLSTQQSVFEMYEQELVWCSSLTATNRAAAGDRPDAKQGAPKQQQARSILNMVGLPLGCRREHQLTCRCAHSPQKQSAAPGAPAAAALHPLRAPPSPAAAAGWWGQAAQAGTAPAAWRTPQRKPAGSSRGVGGIRGEEDGGRSQSTAAGQCASSLPRLHAPLSRRALPKRAVHSAWHSTCPPCRTHQDHTCEYSPGGRRGSAACAAHTDPGSGACSAAPGPQQLVAPAPVAARSCGRGESGRRGRHRRTRPASGAGGPPPCRKQWRTAGQLASSKNRPTPILQRQLHGQDPIQFASHADLSEDVGMK